MVARQQPLAIRYLGNRRKPRPATRLGSVGKWGGPASLTRRVARSARRMLRQVDRRREVFHLPVEPSDLGSSAKRQLYSVRTQAHSIDFQSAVVVLSASEQGWQETVRDWSDVPRRVDALRLKVWPVRTLS